MRQLNIDPEFRDKIPPMSADEFSRLRENILNDGEVIEPIVVWNNTIIDGHNRWRIIQENPKIPYRIKEMQFADKWAAIVWMCRNQIGRRNITDEQKTVLIGEAYKAQKMTYGGARKSSAQNEHLKGRTAEKIAKDFGVGKETVKRSERFLDGLNEAEKVSPGIKEAVLNGAIKVPKSKISEIRYMDEEEKENIVKAIKEGKISEKQKSRNPEGYSKERRALNKIIEDVASSMYDTNRSVEHTADDLVEDLSYIIKDFTGKVRRSLQIHSTLLQDAVAKEKAIAALSEAKAAIEELKGLIP